jgi:hypothetical protein
MKSIPALFGLGALATMVLVAACSSDANTKVAPAPDAADANALDAMLPDATPMLPDSSARDAAQVDDAARDAPLADAAKDAEPVSALGSCLTSCAAAAPQTSRDLFYNSVRSCACTTLQCNNPCSAGYCAATAPAQGACGDCVARAYEDPRCSSELKCEGDGDCVTFADCARACVMKTP